jgi:hypothetical protein
LIASAGQLMMLLQQQKLLGVDGDKGRLSIAGMSGHERRSKRAIKC